MNFHKTEILHTITLTDNDLFVIGNALNYYLENKANIYPPHKAWYEKTLSDIDKVLEDKENYKFNNL